MFYALFELKLEGGQDFWVFFFHTVPSVSMQRYDKNKLGADHASEIFGTLATAADALATADTARQATFPHSNGYFWNQNGKHERQNSSLMAMTK